MPNGRLTDPAPLQRAAGFRLEAEAAWLRDFLSARLWTADKLNAAAEARP
jgi:hypothetical protein